MNDKGLAKLGDSLVNLCYSLAKSIVLGKPMGEKVRDSVLARAIRANPVYNQLGRRADIGTAADAYEAIMAYLWISEIATIESIVEILTESLDLDSKTSRKEEGKIATSAFHMVLEHFSSALSVLGDNNKSKSN